jgi:hypothetical protein
MDADLTRWFGDGSIVESLIGDGDFLIHAPDLEIHDRIFVIGQLSVWIGENEDRRQAARQALVDAIDRLLAAQRPDDAADLLISLLSATESEPSVLGVTKRDLDRCLHEITRQYEGSAGFTTRRQKAIDHIRSELDSRSRLNEWSVAFADLRDSRAAKACPACGRHALKWCVDGNPGAVGSAAVWCERCSRGINLSRVAVRPGDTRCADVPVPPFWDDSG